MNEVIKTLCTRRSIRRFKNKQVPEKELNEILKCGLYAPSGKNNQDVKIVVIRNSELISKIAKVNASFVNKPGLNPFYDAKTLLIVFANRNHSTYIHDGSATIMNMLNAAFSLGIDSCWIHRAEETFKTEFGKKLKEEWGLKEEYEGIGNIVLGYRDIELPPSAPRKDRIIYVK